MPLELTPELNLVVANDDLDTADYLVLTEGLAGALRILDGLFSAATGHAHNGSHQGGELQFLDLEIGEDLTVNGTLVVKQSTSLQGVLNVTGLATCSGDQHGRSRYGRQHSDQRHAQRDRCNDAGDHEYQR